MVAEVWLEGAGAIYARGTEPDQILRYIVAFEIGMTAPRPQAPHAGGMFLRRVRIPAHRLHYLRNGMLSVMHKMKSDIEALSSSILAYAMERLRMDPPTIDHALPQTTLEELAGQTITEEGLAARRRR